MVYTNCNDVYPPRIFLGNGCEAHEGGVIRREKRSPGLESLLCWACEAKQIAKIRSKGDEHAIFNDASTKSIILPFFNGRSHAG